MSQLANFEKKLESFVDNLSERMRNYSPKRESASPLPFLLAGAALGAVAMYFLDPAQGGSRRNMVKEKSKGLGNDAAEFAGRHAKNISQKAQGVISTITGKGEEMAESNQGRSGAETAANERPLH